MTNAKQHFNKIGILGFDPYELTLLKSALTTVNFHWLYYKKPNNFILVAKLMSIKESTYQK